MDRFTYMENRYGHKPPLCAAAGINPDATWSLAVANQTGIPSPLDAPPDYAIYEPANTYDITFDVEELRSAGDQKLDMFVSSGTRQIAREAEMTMTQGRVTVTVAPHELVTLWPKSKIIPAAVRRQELSSSYSGLRIIRISSSALPRYIISFSVPETSDGADIVLTVQDMRGRQVAVVPHHGGEQAVQWDGQGPHGLLAQGVYALRLTSGGQHQICNFVVSK
jgi:hypothetical protein